MPIRRHHPRRAIGFALFAAWLLFAGTASAATVPKLVGLTKEEAERRVSALGLKFVISWSVQPRKARRVVAQLPPANFDLDPDSSVALWISTGLLPTGRAAAEFRTTAGAAYCQVDSGGEVAPALTCWTPNDGYMVTLMASGIEGPPHASYEPRARGVPSNGDGFRTIGYGGRWTRHGIRCRSERAGLTCTNPMGHGFWLGRYRGVRRF